MTDVPLPWIVSCQPKQTEQFFFWRPLQILTDLFPDKQVAIICIKNHTSPTTTIHHHMLYTTKHHQATHTVFIQAHNAYTTICYTPPNTTRLHTPSSSKYTTSDKLEVSVALGVLVATDATIGEESESDDSPFDLEAGFVVVDHAAGLPLEAAGAAFDATDGFFIEAFGLVLPPLESESESELLDELEVSDELDDVVSSTTKTGLASLVTGEVKGTCETSQGNKTS
jgi:hypothetical protein